MGHLADGDQRPVNRLDRQVVEFIDGLGAVIEQDRVFVEAQLGGAHRDDLVLQRQGIAHILGRQAFGGQRLRVEVEGDLPLLAAHRCRHGQARQGAQGQADIVLHQVANFGFRQAGAGERHLQDRHRGGAVVEDQRRGDARWHLLEHGL